MLISIQSSSEKSLGFGLDIATSHLNTPLHLGNEKLSRRNSGRDSISMLLSTQFELAVIW